MKKNKGITLIALIVTIVIMLILIGVSMKIVIDGNLFTSAQNAVDKTNNKVAQQQNIVNGLMDELGEIERQQIISSCKHEWVSGVCTKCGEKEPLPAITAGIIATKTSEFTDTAGKKAVIPRGFTVSGILAEQTIDGGLVIYDTEGATISTWTDSVKTEYNQFVWIPVEVNESTDSETSIASFYSSKWVYNASTGWEKSTVLDSNYTEPYSYDDSDYDGTGAGKTGISAQITELTKSIYKYGGFYIGRYEAGTETTPIVHRPEPSSYVIQQDKYPYILVAWGKSMGNVSEKAGAVYLCNTLYTGKTDYGVKSMLCPSAAWDSMLDFLSDSYPLNGIGWGNYQDSDSYKVYRGSLYSNSTWTEADTLNGSTVTNGDSILLTTGATERNCSKNIYDVAGNAREFTTEADGADRRVSRGGSYAGTYESPCTRSSSNVNGGVGWHDAFRPVLFVTL